MSQFHKARLLTDLIIDVLTSAGLNVGDAQKPPPLPDDTIVAGWTGTPGASTFLPYIVVYNLVGGSSDGTLENPDEDAWPIYQFTATGASRSQCEFIADEAREVILTMPLTLNGRKVASVGIDMLGAAVRDDDAQPPIWYSPDRYRLLTTPALDLTP